MRSLTIERWITSALAIATLVLLGFQFSSIYITPIHDSYLWWGDESWLMNEYREQMTSGIFRHPQAYGSSLWIGNPFPFTAMWLSSAIYGAAALVSDSTLVDAGRTITAVLALLLLLSIWRGARSLALTGLAISAGISLLVSSRSFFLTSHSARYDIATALAVIAISYLLIQDLQSKRARSFLRLGLLWGASMIVSIHVPLLLLLPVCYYLVVQRVSLKDLVRVVLGAIVSVGALFLIHLLTQPSLVGETNLSENLRTIPILRPFSWSVQSSNFVQKWDLITSFAPQILLCLLAIFEGLRCRSLARTNKQATVLLALPMIGWLLFQPAGPSSYVIHFLPCLVLAAAISIETMLVGNWQRIAIGVVAAVLIALGVRDAVIAGKVGAELAQAHREAISRITSLSADKQLVALNPAQSHLQSQLQIAATTHFVELPHRQAMQLSGEGYLVTYNSSILPNFMWEVAPLRSEVTSPDLVQTGRLLDAGRSYFEPLDSRLDTIFLQRVDLTSLYTRHID
jgi:hypothetical protein